MGAGISQNTVIQHQNLIRKTNRSRSLGHNKGSRWIFHLADAHSKTGIGGIIQRRGAVVQNQYLWLSYQRPGDSQPLALTAGEVASPLLDHGVQFAGLVLDHLTGLGKIQRFPKLIVGGVFPAPKQIFPDRTTEQHSFLRNDANEAAKLIFIHVGHIHTVDQHTAITCPVQARDQIHQGGFAGAGTANDTDGLTRLCPEADALQRIGRSAGIADGNILKFHTSGNRIHRFTPVGRCSFDLKHIPQPVAGSHRLGDGDDQICHLDQLHQDLGHIIVQGNDHTLGQNTALYLQCAHLNQCNNGNVDDRIGQRIHDGRDPTGGKLAGGQIPGLALKILDLLVFLAESPQDANAG